MSGPDKSGSVGVPEQASATDASVDEASPVSILKTIDFANARQRLDEAAARQTSTVSYRSEGHCLIIGERASAMAAADRFGEAGATVVSIVPDLTRPAKALSDAGLAVFSVGSLSLHGYLGAFTAIGRGQNGDQSNDQSGDKGSGKGSDPGAIGELDLGVSARRPSATFDCVLDLSPEPLLNVGLPPFGYQHAPLGQGIDAAIDSLSELIGEFDKPRYFDYDRSICAHSRSRLPGCNRCIDVCVTGAISSVGDGIEVDPFLCQGCGSCATLCPTGAMVYAYPKPSDAIERTRTRLRAGSFDTLLLHDESSQAVVDVAGLPATILALAVEEVTAFGIDYWASILCAGVSRILVLCSASEDDPNRHALEEQADLLRALLAGLDAGPDVIQLIDVAGLDDVDRLPTGPDALTALAPVNFVTHDDKRATVRAALDRLAEGLDGEIGDVCALPAGAPFGRIVVDTDACTLCMACVSTCPAGALLDGQETPALRMVEANCVQCGLCEQACPESAIELEARYVRDSVAARRICTLHEEAPFDCIVCRKPFATQRIIDTLIGKLSAHWMFGEEHAVRRLKMCADCRVKDIFTRESGGIDVHSGSDKVDT